MVIARVPIVPTSVLAALVAVLAALATPALLRRLRPPEEQPDLDYRAVGTTRFGLAVFAIGFPISWLSLSLTTPDQWALWAPFVGLGTVLGLIDARTTFLPLRLHYLTFALVAVGAALAAWWRCEPQLLGWAVGIALAATAGYALIWWISGGELGFGDVRLASLIGFTTAATSPEVAMWGFLAGSIIGAGWAIIVRVRGRRAFAYGPSMLLGAPTGLVIAALLG